jgi:3-hydroxy-9,10-secoandrosta-1,3,5(10)-triene-9,17-dione monooxygenase
MQLTQDFAPPLTPTDVINRAQALIPRLRDRIVETEALRRLPDATIQDARDAGIFSLLLPVSLGGLGGSLSDLVEVLRYLAQGDPTVAWTVGFLTEHNWMLARYPKAAQDEVFAAGGPALMAAVANPPRHAVPVDGGYLVTGEWGYASGVMHSDWVQVTAIIEGSDHPSLFLIPRDEIEVKDTWYMSGMTGTGSHNVKLDTRFVPEHRAVDIVHWHSRNNDGGQMHPEPIYRYDARDLLNFVLPAMMVGASEATLEFYRERLDRRRAAFSKELTGDTVLGQTRYARSLAALRSAKALLRTAQEEVVNANANSDEGLPDEQRALLKLDCLSICDLAWKATEIGVGGSGSSIYQKTDITQHFIRDMQTLLSHLTIDPDGMRSKAGEILLGRVTESEPARNFT